ncbi:coiled-coil domain-containing protein 85C isoform X3 [Strongylocentrotus purpuratus]|uniref:Coiled-coil domain-containing protein 85C n=1 Tax=Strongylocentrotus purpuratus TaxID=7668 RepID=A0A7M7HJ95_STRPU|nr:coiled-coil domain-containing protein 85C isoform X3 [Strongylocentrotus purpuratus]|eukprot:XP_011672359.1 PREDICTED: coiled-coil domain-containing protein 85C isoform X3 [Strongylocentrotus purpuratus]
MAVKSGPRFTTDEELKKLSWEDVVKRLRWCEKERMKLLSNQGGSVKEIEHLLMLKTNEIQALKIENQKLHGDNVELRELCCFLDDDRQKGKKVSTEWQRFGQYTTNVMRNGVSTYQDKLRELEERQEKLCQENVELRELCFLLDQERTGNQSTLLSLGNGIDLREKTNMSNGPSSVLNDGHLSKEGSSKMWGNGGDISALQNNDHMPFTEDRIRSFDEKRQFSQPEVLEVHDMLERDTTPNHLENDHMNTNEKAIVREMCNVVWRKLGDNPNNPNGTGPNGTNGTNGSSNGSGSNQSQRPQAPTRYSNSTVNPPAKPAGYSTPPYSSGSTGSLERKGI